MPYTVTSHCDTCSGSDEFMIGDWKKHLGVYICRDPCRSIVSVPLDTSQCPGCGQDVDADQCYDYAPSIPYLNGEFVVEPESGPTCPKCGEGQITFRPTIHHNMGVVLGRRESARYQGKDYLEKQIFGHALMAACYELQLEPDDEFAYFDLDRTPKMRDRIQSLGIERGPRPHVVADVGDVHPDLDRTVVEGADRDGVVVVLRVRAVDREDRSEEHTSELQSH